jgi:hypothetical protein
MQVRGLKKSRFIPFWLCFDVLIALKDFARALEVRCRGEISRLTFYGGQN